MKGERTPWRRRKEGQSQSTEGNWIREVYSHPEDRKVKDKSGYKKKAAKRGALTPWRPQRDKSEYGKKTTGRGGPLTHWRSHREEKFRTKKAAERETLTL